LDCGEVFIEYNSVVWQFDRFANDYSNYNQIQREIAKELVSKIKREIYRVADIGSGNGAVYQEFSSQNIKFETFYALDFSSEMLKNHIKSRNVKVVKSDFNREDFKSILKSLNLDTVISSSALQWSDSPKRVFEILACESKYIYLSIFTSNTFKSLHKLAGIDSPIHSKNSLKNALNRYFILDELYEKQYKIYFKDRREIFKYIKKSGVSGGQMRLGFKEAKRLILSYPHNYLEFEVLFVVAKSKKYFSKS